MTLADDEPPKDFSFFHILYVKNTNNEKMKEKKNRERERMNFSRGELTFGGAQQKVVGNMLVNFKELLSINKT